MRDEFANFCSNIRYLRRKNGLTQKQMAQKLHISENYVRKLERGQIPHRLGIDVIWHTHIAFGVPVQDILECLLENTDSPEACPYKGVRGCVFCR